MITSSLVCHLLVDNYTNYSEDNNTLLILVKNYNKFSKILRTPVSNKPIYYLEILGLSYFQSSQNLSFERIHDYSLLEMFRFAKYNKATEFISYIQKKVYDMEEMEKEEAGQRIVMNFILSPIKKTI